MDDIRATTVVIGSSAGGSSGVESILAELPVGVDIRLLLVQHMLESFTGRFADRLDSASSYDVRESEFEDTLGVDEALVAKGDLNMEVVGEKEGGRRIEVELNKKSRFHSLRPSVDVTMSSAADVVDGNLVGVLLSGMGSDGVRGVEKVKQAGGTTIAQDEESSRVFGMPRRAIDSGHVDHVLPEDEIAEAILETAGEDLSD